MFAKTFAAAAAALALAGAAHAQSLGFEDGSNAAWTPNTNPILAGDLVVQSYGSDITVTDNYYAAPPISYTYTVDAPGVEFGNSFGVLSTGARTGAGIRTASMAATTGADLFALQLYSMDYYHRQVDSVEVVFLNATGGASTASWDTYLTYQDAISDPAHPGIGASGWLVYNVPTGTTAIDIYLENSAAGYNAPLLAFDYAAAPVPEAETYAMMMAGLGVLGFVSRRRKASQR